MCNRDDQVTNIYLKHSQPQWVSQPVFVNDERSSIIALHINAGEGMQLGVHPVEPLGQQVWVGIRECYQVRPGWHFI